MNKNAEILADLIAVNPNAHFQIDNDSWTMLKNSKSKKEITDSGELNWETEFYGNSSLYGAGIAEALITLLNRNDGMRITAESV